MNKLLITLFLFSLAAGGKAQVSHKEQVGKLYMVEYIYNPDQKNIVLNKRNVEGASESYPAKIRVYYDNILVDSSMGVYTPGEIPLLPVRRAIDTKRSKINSLVVARKAKMKN